VTPEEFYDQIEHDRDTYKLDRYSFMPGRLSPEWRELKGHEDAAQYLMDALDRVNPRSSNYLSPKEQEARYTFLMAAQRRVEQKIGRLRQSQSKARATMLIMADALEVYLPHMMHLPWSTAGEVDAYLKQRQQARLREIAASVQEIEYTLFFATTRMKQLREALEELYILQERVEDTEREEAVREQDPH
jgi:hypothetical protein